MPTFVSAYKPAGTKSGRLASSKLLGIFGGNGQNVADHTRQLFIPRPGYAFIQNDLEGAEAVAVALYVDEGNFRELVRRKVKIHNFVCPKIFPGAFSDYLSKDEIDTLTPASFAEHGRYKEIIKHCKALKTEYDLAKRTVHGCLTADHEVLTPLGWIPIADAVADPTLAIAVVSGNDNRHITFEFPKARLSGLYRGHIYTYITTDIVMEVTDDHGMAFCASIDGLFKIAAAAVDYSIEYQWPLYDNTTRLRHKSQSSRLCRLTDPHEQVYCFTTSTGYFLARHNSMKPGLAFATGNSNYGMSWKTFQETVLKGTDGRVVLPAAECKRLLNAYADLFPEVKLWQGRVDNDVQAFSPITNLFGWSVRTIARYTTALGRTGISWGPQSTVGIATILAGIRFQEYIEEHKLRWNILNIVHDSILAEAPAEEAEHCAAVLAECMKFTLTSPVDGWVCTIGVEKSVGDNWGKYDENKNPNGLKVIV